MYVQVAVVPPNKNYIVLRQVDGKIIKFPREYARYVQVGDIGSVSEYRGRPQLKLLTDEDDVVIMNHPDRKQLVPYGFFGPMAKPPEPIQTPRTNYE